MINIQKEIEARKLATKMLITVHDELVFDAPTKERNEVTDLITEKEVDTILDAILEKEVSLI